MDIEGQRSKEDQPSVGFPDICFAIEDFDVAFKGLVSAGHLAFMKSPCCSSQCRYYVTHAYFCPAATTAPCS